MKCSVLIDLDDTLLSNDMDTFLKVYLKALGQAVSSVIPADKMIPQLLYATGKMSSKKSPLMTLEEVFDQNFYPSLGFRKDELEPILMAFYENEFPKIQVVTNQKPAAAKLLKELVSQGCDIVIATNPLFPQTAVLQRVRWAGLADFLPSIKFLTSFESFHFAKPHSAYYAEILGQIGWPNQPAVMVGNSLSDDIIPAAKLGLPVYWVNGESEPLPQGVSECGSSGDLDGVIPWLKAISINAKAPVSIDPAGLLAELAAAPAALDTILRPMETNDWKNRPADNEWSPTEILCHLRDVEQDVNLIRLPMLLNGDNPFLQAVDSDPWAVERAYQNQDGKQALEAFIRSRITLLEALENLAPEKWQLPARHAIFGPITLKDLIGIIASHDRAHLNQLVCTVNS